jgi:sulfonate transport system permease protein
MTITYVDTDTGHELAVARAATTGANVLAHKRSRRRRVPRSIRKLTGPVALLLTWVVLNSTGTVDAQLLPAPLDVLRAGWHLEQTGELWSNLSASLSRVVQGLGFGVLIGTALAIVAGLSRLGEDLVDSSMQLLKSVPHVALVPLLIMWFGIDEQPRVLLIVAGTCVPIYINTYSAIRNVDADIVEAARSFGARRLSLVAHVILPGALPGFLVGLRFALASAWLSLVFAETINTDKGLGYLMGQAETLLQTDVMFFTLVVYAVIGLLSYALVRLLERHLLAWRRGFEGS